MPPSEKPAVYRVMVSSTYLELKDHRRVILDALPSQHLLPVAMEYDAAISDKDLIDASLAKVELSDAYVGLISYRYGQAPVCPTRNQHGLSLTELEFDRALKRGLPICIFVMDDAHLVTAAAVRDGKAEDKERVAAFIRRARDGRISENFISVDDLRAKAILSIGDLRKVLDRQAPKPSDAAGTAKRSALAVSNIPIDVPLHFMGRDVALADIADGLKRSAEGRVAITALHGLRGVGKTTLAAAFAARHRADYRATWWIRAQTEPTMRADLVALGVRLGWSDADAKEEPALAAVMDRLRHEGDGLLLVYDNAIDASHLKPFLPRGGGAHVLVTSNAPNWGNVAKPVSIGVWPKTIGASYLVARISHSADPAVAESLSEALGGLPLAHEQAAAYCERLGVSLAEYAKRFAAAPAKLMDTRDAPGEYHDGLTVAKTFALAIEEATKIHPAAEPLIVHAALLAPEPIPLYLFSEGRGSLGEPLATLLADDGLDEAIAALRGFALVDREAIADERDPAITTDTIRLHRLVRDVAAARCMGEGRDDLRGVLIKALAKVYPNGVFNDPTTWPRARRLDVIALAAVAPGFDVPSGVEPAACHLLDQLASYRQSSLAAYASARQLFTHALTIAETRLGAEHPATTTALNDLACLLQAQGDLDGARPLYERALAIREKVLGPDHPDTATSLNNLAVLVQAQGDFDGARPRYQQALAIHEKVLGPDHPDTATSLNNLAYLVQAQGDFDGARPRYQQALAIREKVLGPDHPDTAGSLNNLAVLVQAQGDFDGARPLHQRALAIREKVLGPDHPDTALSLNNLAVLLRAQGDLDGARPLYERALAINEKVLGPDHPNTATSLNNLAVLLRAQGDLDGARPLYERALAIREKVLGPDHPDTATSLNNLAYLVQAQGDFDGARPRYQQALAIREKVLGPDHPDTAGSLNNLAVLVQAQGDFDGARPLHQRALAIREKVLGPDHPDTALSLNNLAVLLRAQGDLDGARPLYERALAINEKVLGPDHPNTATSLNNLAVLLRAQGDLDGARPLYERALAIREKVLGPDHPDTATSLNNLAVLLRAQGDLDGARPLYERALAIREKVLGPDHPDTARSLNNLAGLLQAQGDLDGARLLYERALAIRQRVLGLHHPWTKGTARGTADVLAALGEPDKAAEIRARFGLDPVS